jgi:LDH2 family malate/lactate/ureidoglycolate dehydrogenase
LPRFDAERLKKIGTDIFVALGTPKRNAEIVADVLVKANLMGHESHGVAYFIRYSDRIRRGIIDPKAEPEIVQESSTTALIDGHWGFGQLTANKVMEVAIEKARTSHISAVGACHCNHTTRLGEYSMLAARRNMIGMLFANVPFHGNVQPYGAAAGLLGTNPLSVAVPTEKMDPFFFDFATSAVAERRVTLAAARGEKIPFGWIVDKNGNPTDDPTDLNPPNSTRDEDRGRLLTFGAAAEGQGHKGYCLSILVEILGGILNGSGSLVANDVRQSQNGLLAIAIDIGSFVPAETFKKTTDALFQRIRQTPVQPRFEHDHVLIPGELEWNTMGKRLKEGVEVSESTWREIVNVATELGLKVQSDI